MIVKWMTRTQIYALASSKVHHKSEEEQALPEFDAPQPEAAAGSSASAVWKTLASTILTKMKAAKFGRVDV